MRLSGALFRESNDLLEDRGAVPSPAVAEGSVASFWRDRRVAVTGGNGFLGRFVVTALHRHGWPEPFIVRSRQYDLRSADAITRLLTDTKPELVLHLAAEVGGIGANRANPGRYWYANLMMGAHVLEQSRLHGVDKLVVLGTVCAYPKFAPVPFHEDDLWNGYPEETNAPTGWPRRCCSCSRRPIGSSTDSTPSSCSQ
jgi:GDP-L-fucose synthase